MERIRRKMERDGSVADVVEADTPDEVEALLPAIAAIAAIAQRDRYKPGELEELAQGTLPGTVAAMVRAGRLHVTLLRIDGRPAAFSFDLVGGGTVQGHLMAYDSEWQPYAPGMRCMEEAFRWTVSSGAHEFDLGVGVGGYKQRWSRDEYHTRRVVAAPSPAELALARAGMSLRARVTGLLGAARLPCRYEYGRRSRSRLGRRMAVQLDEQARTLGTIKTGHGEERHVDNQEQRAGNDDGE